MIKKTTLIIILIVGLIFAMFITIKKSYFLTHDIILTEKQISILKTLGDSALNHQDVPVASILLYNDTIIGMGYNTVIAKSNAGGHAEINAISSAISLLGKEKFDTLKRKNLVLVTTFEPCLMCRGAIIEYGIKRVVFLKPKSLVHWFYRHVSEIRYEITKKHGEPELLQDSLFVRHRVYKKNTQQ